MENFPNSTWKTPQQKQNKNHSKHIYQQKPTEKSQKTQAKPLKNNGKRSIKHFRLHGKTKQRKTLKISW